MATSLSSPADVVNDALVRIGYKRQVGDLNDGSEASQLAIQIYGQTRDDLLRGGNWQFASRTAPLALLKQAPANGTYLVPWTDAYPPLPWLYEYAYPDDCLKFRAVKATPVFIPNPTPMPNSYGLANDDTYTPPKQVILCNVPDAIGIFTARVLDPRTWSVDFTEALAEQLGKRLAPALAGLQAAQLEAAEAAAGTDKAMRTQG